MATELQSGLNATELIPEKQGVDSEAPVGKPPSGHEVPATEVASVDGESYVSGHQGGEIPVGDGHSETADLSDSNYSNASSAGSTPRYEKAEAFLEARRERVEVEANAYLESEIRKVNARAHTAQVHLSGRLILFPPLALGVLQNSSMLLLHNNLFTWRRP